VVWCIAPAEIELGAFWPQYLTAAGTYMHSMYEFYVSMYVFYSMYSVYFENYCRLSPQCM